MSSVQQLACLSCCLGTSWGHICCQRIEGRSEGANRSLKVTSPWSRWTWQIFLKDWCLAWSSLPVWRFWVNLKSPCHHSLSRRASTSSNTCAHQGSCETPKWRKSDFWARGRPAALIPFLFGLALRFSLSRILLCRSSTASEAFGTHSGKTTVNPRSYSPSTPLLVWHRSLWLPTPEQPRSGWTLAPYHWLRTAYTTPKSSSTPML